MKSYVEADEVMEWTPMQFLRLEIETIESYLIKNELLPAVSGAVRENLKSVERAWNLYGSLALRKAIFGDRDVFTSLVGSQLIIDIFYFYSLSETEWRTFEMQSVLRSADKREKANLSLLKNFTIFQKCFEHSTTF